MSGFGQQETLAKLRDAGRVDFLAKPFTTEELLAALTHLQAPLHVDAPPAT
jgi:DNA-binding response OmpR family regulator